MESLRAELAERPDPLGKGAWLECVTPAVAKRSGSSVQVHVLKNHNISWEPATFIWGSFPYVLKERGSNYPSIDHFTDYFIFPQAPFSQLAGPVSVTAPQMETIPCLIFFLWIFSRSVLGEGGWRYGMDRWKKDDWPKPEHPKLGGYEKLHCGISFCFVLYPFSNNLQLLFCCPKH